MDRPHAIIIGAGPGMGLAIARRFAKGGFNISLMARRKEALDRQVGSVRSRRGSAAGFVVDAASEASITEAVASAQAAFGPCEVLVYNPAARIPSPLSEIKPEALVDSFRVNVAGALAATRAVLPGMRERARGTLLFTGGGLALRPMPNFAALAIGKAGLRSLAQSLSIELHGSGVYVGSVLIAGYVQSGTAFDPDTIAEVYWRLFAERPAEPEVIFKG